MLQVLLGQWAAPEEKLFLWLRSVMTRLFSQLGNLPKERNTVPPGYQISQQDGKLLN
jgi:hypothetical protein